MAAARAMVAGCVSHLPQCVGVAVGKGSGRQALASTSALAMRAMPLRHSFLHRAAVQSRSLQGCRVVCSAEYTTAEEGAPDSLEYRVFFNDKSGKAVSPWHDIPLHAGDGLFNFVVEIPKETKAKMEVATEEPNTPIKQDTKKGKLRFYPYNINWNYGLLPQTWEDRSHSNSDVENAFGDNDPVDVVEIGERQAKLGEVLKVKPLAVLAMIDEGELDRKVVAISVDDPKADLVNNVADVEKHFPGTLTAIRDWFRDYKIPDGKPANKFGLDNKAADKDYALVKGSGWDFSGEGEGDMSGEGQGNMSGEGQGNMSDRLIALEKQLDLLMANVKVLNKNRLCVLAGEVVAGVASKQGHSVVSSKSYQFFVTSPKAAKFATDFGMEYSAFLPLLERVLENGHLSSHFSSIAMLEVAVKNGMDMMDLDKKYFQREIPDEVFILEKFSELRQCFGTF